jgi:hypothetical protein
MVRISESSLIYSGLSIATTKENLSDDADTVDSVSPSPDYAYVKLSIKSTKAKKQSKTAPTNNEEVDDRPVLPSGKIVPIPKGKSPYALAKNAEYYDKDNVKAEKLYRQAISQGDRAESSLKDLASLLHRLGKTQQAIELLQ